MTRNDTVRDGLDDTPILMTTWAIMSVVIGIIIYIITGHFHPWDVIPAALLPGFIMITWVMITGERTTNK